MDLNQNELQVLMAGLNALSRQGQDIQASKYVLSLYNKLEQEVRHGIQPKEQVETKDPS